MIGKRWFGGLLAALTASLLAAAAAVSALPPAAENTTGHEETSTVLAEDVIRVSGYERLAWEYDGEAFDQPGRLSFVGFVDDVAVRLEDVRCESRADPAVLSCTAPLPALQDGVHIIAVAVSIDGRTQPSRSEPVRVELRQPQLSGVVAADGVELPWTTVIDNLVDPTDVAATPGGQILIAERSGRIVNVRNGEPVSLIVDLPEAVTNDGHGLLALAVDTAFESNGAVYALYSTVQGARVVRFELREEALTNRVILLEDLPLAAQNPVALLEISPDGYLVLGLDDGGNPQAAGDMGAYNGKILRFTRDGRTPREGPHPPILLTDVWQPLGATWHVSSAIGLYLIGDAAGNRWLDEVLPGMTSAGQTSTGRCAIPPDLGLTHLMLYDHPATPALRGNLLLGAAGWRGILRVAPRPDGPAVREWLLAGDVDAVRRLVVAPDGSILALLNRRLVRIAPDQAVVSTARSAAIAEQEMKVPRLADFCIPLNAIDRVPSGN